MLIRTLTILIIALTLPPQQGLGQEELLHWKFAAGDSVKYNVVQKMTTSRNIGKQNITQSMNQSMEMEWNVQSKTTSGAAMHQVVKRIQLMSEGGPAGTINFDTNNSTKPENPIIASMAETFQKIVNQPFGITMKPTGEIETVQVPPKLIEAIRQSAAGNPAALNEETLKQMMKQSAVTLPAGKVAPNDTWTSNQSVQLPFGTMNIKSNMTYENNDENGNASIKVIPQISVTPKQGAPIKMTLSSSKGEGRVLFHIANGRVTESSLKLELEMKIETAQGQVFHQTIDQVTTMKLVP